jgi:hypothetical protein
MYKAGSLRAVAEEISKYKLELAGMQEVRWDRGGIAPADENTFFYEKANENHELGTGFSYIRESNFHVPTEDKNNDIKDRFYEEIELLLDKFPK